MAGFTSSTSRLRQPAFTSRLPRSFVVREINRHLSGNDHSSAMEIFRHLPHTKSIRVLEHPKLSSGFGTVIGNEFMDAKNIAGLLRNIPSDWPVHKHAPELEDADIEAFYAFTNALSLSRLPRELSPSNNIPVLIRADEKTIPYALAGTAISGAYLNAATEGERTRIFGAIDLTFKLMTGPGRSSASSVDRITSLARMLSVLNVTKPDLQVKEQLPLLRLIQGGKEDTSD